MVKKYLNIKLKYLYAIYMKLKKKQQAHNSRRDFDKQTSPPGVELKTKH